MRPTNATERSTPRPSSPWLDQYPATNRLPRTEVVRKDAVITARSDIDPPPRSKGNEAFPILTESRTSVTKSLPASGEVDLFPWNYRGSEKSCPRFCSPGGRPSVARRRKPLASRTTPTSFLCSPGAATVHRQGLAP